MMMTSTVLKTFVILTLTSIFLPSCLCACGNSSHDENGDIYVTCRFPVDIQAGKTSFFLSYEKDGAPRFVCSCRWPSDGRAEPSCSNSTGYSLLTHTNDSVTYRISASKAASKVYLCTLASDQGHCSVNINITQSMFTTLSPEISTKTTDDQTLKEEDQTLKGAAQTLKGEVQMSYLIPLLVIIAVLFVICFLVFWIIIQINRKGHGGQEPPSGNTHGLLVTSGDIR